MAGEEPAVVDSLRKRSIQRPRLSFSKLQAGAGHHELLENHVEVL
jgi:hypothetical protein